MTRSSMRDRDIDEGVRDALDEREVETPFSAEHSGATDQEGPARDIYLLSIAVDLMANLFEQLQSVRDDDAALDRDLMIEGHLISAQIIEAQELVSRLNFAANGAKDAELMARARVILGPLGRKLDRLAGYLDRREALLADTLSVEGEIFGEWIESPQHSRSH
jgi:hypothetical protein